MNNWMYNMELAHLLAIIVYIEMIIIIGYIHINPMQVFQITFSSNLCRLCQNIVCVIYVMDVN